MAAAAISGKITPGEFLKAVRKGTTFDVLLLRGDEEFMLREALKEYTTRAVSPAAADFDYSELRAAETDGGTVWNALTTMPFMGQRRVVVVDMSGDPKAETVKTLMDFAARPSKTTSLIMVSAGDGSRDVPTPGLPKSMVEVAFTEMKLPERAAWIAAYAKRSEKTLHDDALQYLLDTSSKSLTDLAAKVDHAVLYVGDEKEISVQVLMKVSGVSSEYTVFQLEDALLKQRQVEAHTIARSLLEGGEALLRLLAFHRGSVLRLWKVSRAIGKKSDWQKSKEAEDFWRVLFGRQSFKIPEFKSAAKAMGETRIRQAILGLVDLEVWAKSGSAEPFRYYEWLWRITTPGATSEEPGFLFRR
jgi:DNA polymerase III subunit delta